MVEAQSLYEPAEYTKEEIAASLPGVQGRSPIWPLDNELIGEYVALMNAELAMDQLSQHYHKRHLAETLDVAVHEETSMHDVTKSVLDFKLFASEAEAVDYFKRWSKWTKLNGQFWDTVRDTFNNWNHHLEICDGFRVVSCGKKFVTKGK